MFDAVQDKIEKILDQIEEGNSSTNIAQRLAKREDEMKLLKKRLSLEEAKQRLLDSKIVRDFLKSLKNGNCEDKTYQKMMIRLFIDRIYLYDDHFRIILHKR